MIDEALVTKLISATPLAAGRVYHQVVPQPDVPTVALNLAAYPCVIYEETGGTTGRNLSGRDGLSKLIYTVQFLAAKSADTKAMARGCYALEGKWGVVSGVTVDWCFVEDSADQYDNPQSGSEKGMRRSVLDITLWYREF